MSVLSREVSARHRLANVLGWACCGVLVLAAAKIALPSNAADQNRLVIAQFDGQSVTGEEFTPYLRAYLRSKLFHAASPERMRALAEEAVEAFLIDRILAAQAAARGLKIDDAEVDKRLTDIKTKFGDRPGWADISARLQKLRQEIETDLKIGALKQEITRADPPTEAEVRTYYESRTELFTRPATYRLKLLLIAVEPGAGVDIWRAAEEQAQNYARRVASGEDFEVLARAKSNHSSAGQGGALGLVHEGQLGEAAEAVLRTTKPGVVAGPVRLLEGVALFQVDERSLSTLMPFPDVKERAFSLLERERAKERWNSHIASIRGRFSIDRSVFAEFLADALR